MCKAWVDWEGAKSFYALSGHISCLVLNPEAVLTTLFRSFYGDFFTQAELIKSLAIKLSLPPWKFGECWKFEPNIWLVFLVTSLHHEAN